MANATVKFPIFIKVGAKTIELGELEMDVKVMPSGRIVTPTKQEIRRAFKNVKC